MAALCGLCACALLAGGVPAAGQAATFGKTTVGATRNVFSSERKRANRYSLSSPGIITQLSVYLEPTSTSGQQVIEGVVYADSGGSPGALLAATKPITFTSTQSAGWYQLALAAPLELQAGNYWIGVLTGAAWGVAGYRYDAVVGSRAYNQNAFSSGPSNPFGSVTKDEQQMSLYATYSSAPPANTSPPVISGAAQQGTTLSATTGAWTGSPSAYAYQWQRCNAQGAACTPIALATTSTYTVVEADAGSTLRVAVTASNAAGASAPASSAATAVVAPGPPVAEAPPTISGTAAQGQTLSEQHGKWSNNPTSYAYQWLQCNGEGSACVAISGATAQSYTASAADVGHTLEVQETASNAGGPGAPATSAATAAVASGQVPANTSPPAISGQAVVGQTLTASTGAWSGSPTQFAYRWKRCNPSGASCLAITGATSPSYLVAEADLGSTLRAYVTATNSFGSSPASASAPTEAVTTSTQPPASTSPPTIGGSAQQGHALTEAHGTWTNEPTGYSYQWQQCDSEGAGCAAIAGATSQTYVPLAADVGHTLRVQETAFNAAGAGSPATSAATAPVSASQSTATFGNTSVGTLLDHGMFSSYKIVHVATLSQPGMVTKLSVYAIPGINSPNAQALKGVIYAGSGGAPGGLLATGSEVAYRGDVNGSGWFDLPFPAPVSLAPGTYWIGFITGETNEGMGYAYETVANSRAYNTNAFAAGPTDPFGTATMDSEQASIYATYVPAGSPPSNTAPPAISGTTQVGATLTASTGSWSEGPTSYAYEWQRCDAQGGACAAISGASAQTYKLTEADVGATLRVAVSASNAAGTSAPATSAQSAVVTGAASVSHLEYVLTEGSISVYDIDHEFKLTKTISLPQTKAGVRGVTVAPASHLMFISFGGDGSINGSGTGSVLAYDLVGEKVLWEVHLKTGIDSGMVSPDGTKIYMPDGESTPGKPGIWNVLSAKTGALTSKIGGGELPHNTYASADGRFVYLGGRGSNYLDAYETATGKVKEIGPLVNTVRPFTVNGSNTLAFTTATEFDGFQVSSITTGKLLATVKLAEFPKGFAFTTASHGIGLSPDEKTVYVLDAVHKELQAYNVHGVAEGIAPSPLWALPLQGLYGQESGCAYDCTRGGWVQLSTDGQLIFVGDSGEVIEAATHKVVATLAPLLDTKKSIEVDWQGGVPVATSGRTGAGQVP